MKKYILIFVLFSFFGQETFAQVQTKNTKQQPNIVKQESGNKKTDSVLLKKITEVRKLQKEQKDRLSQNQTSAERNFNMYKNLFMDRFWRLNPEWATMVGYHFYDSLLIVPNASQREIELSFYKEQLQKIQKFPIDSLSVLNKIDHKVLENELNKYIWQITTLKSYEWDPSEYNIGGSFSYLLSENFKPLNERINSFYLRLKNVPAYFEAAKQNIKNPTQEHLELAAEQNESTIDIFEKDFKDSLKTLGYTAAQQEVYTKRSKEAADAIKSYVKFLKDFKNEKPRSFRLGNELYAKKFEYQIQSQHSIDEIYKAALQRKEFLLNKMEELADDYWTKKMGTQPKPKTRQELIRKVIDIISLDHVKPENFRTEIEKQLPELTAFVKSKNLIFMDPTKPLKVRKEPGYMAGVAGASMSSPGPYEKKGTAYYNVGTLDGWKPEKAESYLREYNKYTLQILNIHEAIPGHYVQLMYSNKSPSVIKSVFGNVAMIEGWAVYSELMMLENGYGKYATEMWLMYYKWNLRTVCNTILDIGVHTKNMSKEDAMDLLVNQAFQQQTEAENKWNRVQLSSVQLDSYFTGFYEITNLRDEYKLNMGAAYSLKKFNEQFLSYGSVPVKYIKEMMIKKVQK
jgi:uncharacterized protein (DUF885 family)